MIETEIKIKPFISIDAIRKRLNEINAVKKDHVIEIDTYYQHPSRDFSKTDEALRLRKVLSHDLRECILSYKGPRRNSFFKKREEVEVIISTNTCDLMDKLLEKIGFTRFIVIEKEREYYSIGECLITIDNVKSLGLFIEIECAEEKLKKILEKLGISYEVVDKTYLELMLQKNSGA